MPILQREFIQFFEEKKKGIYLCPVCASHEFLINVQDDPAPGADENNATLSEMKLDGDSGHTFYGLSCANCGTTTFLHSKQVDSWVAAKKTKGQK